MKKTKKNKVRKVGFFESGRKSIHEAIDYIKESKNYIYFGIGSFIVFLVLGFIFSQELSFLDKYIEKIFIEADKREGFDLMMYIFMNNLSVAFYNVVFGVVFSIFPFLNSVANGGVMGYVFSKVYEIAGVYEFWRIIPHGIFELPAIFIAFGLGIKNGLFLFSKKPFVELKRRLFNSFKVLVYILLPLLFTASIIETLLITLSK